MTTLQLIPFKKTYTLPIRQAVREYISANHKDTHPDAFKWDISRWESLRKECTGDSVHLDRIKHTLSYHAQLVFVLTKLPFDIGLEVSYTPVFNPAALPLTLRNLIYERAGVLFNLAALYSQLAASEDRSTVQGLKQMRTHLQAAAGTLHYMISFATPSLRNSVAEEDMPLDLTDSFLSSLESLMLAQAQEAVWRVAVIDNFKNVLIAKLAARVSSLYKESLRAITESPTRIKHLFPTGWTAHLEAKELHFEAVSQFRKSVDDLDANRYGHEIARLTLAQIAVKKGHEVARKGGVSPTVQKELKSLLDALQTNITRAERDNDLIYHHEVPAASSLSIIDEITMAKATIVEALTEPKTAIGNDAIIFGELLGYGARVAIEIYEDRRKNWLQEEVVACAQRLEDDVTTVLQSLNLPAALEALEKPIGLPPSLLKKAEEVRSEDGPARVQSSVENVRRLAQRNTDLLNEAMDILDQEAERDEVFQAEAPGTRAPSQEANKNLILKADRYRQVLDEATQSDEVVRDKWLDWEQNITELTWNEADLQAAVPSSTTSLASNGGSTSSTQVHARQLRSLLESLDDLQRSRKETVTRAQRRVESDDITPRILKAAAAIERWVEVQPSMFEDVLDEELAKFDKFRGDLDEGAQKQEVLLESIKERNAMFLQSRKEDASVKERERILQSLDLAYHKYKEITRNLDEGLKFYNDLGVILSQFKETCKEWAYHRSDEMNLLVQTLHDLNFDGEPAQPATPAPPQSPGRSAAAFSPVSAPPQTRSHKQGPPKAVLPPLSSGQWETIVLPPPPPKRST
ncbi:BRO1-domain-containing protein [Trametopsis cervina]|nr:BRO1-domain-containing protein [Trametopsis cervina]